MPSSPSAEGKRAEPRRAHSKQNLNGDWICLCFSIFGANEASLTQKQVDRRSQSQNHRYCLVYFFVGTIVLAIVKGGSPVFRRSLLPSAVTQLITCANFQRSKCFCLLLHPSREKMAEKKHRKSTPSISSYFGRKGGEQ